MRYRYAFSCNTLQCCRGACTLALRVYVPSLPPGWRLRSSRPSRADSHIESLVLRGRAVLSPAGRRAYVGWPLVYNSVPPSFEEESCLSLRLRDGGICQQSPKICPPVPQWYI